LLLKAVVEFFNQPDECMGEETHRTFDTARQVATGSGEDGGGGTVREYRPHALPNARHNKYKRAELQHRCRQKGGRNGSDRERERERERKRERERERADAHKRRQRKKKREGVTERREKELGWVCE
jgi:hypothetical protein